MSYQFFSFSKYLIQLFMFLTQNIAENQGRSVGFFIATELASRHNQAHDNTPEEFFSVVQVYSFIYINHFLIYNPSHSTSIMGNSLSQCCFFFFCKKIFMTNYLGQLVLHINIRKNYFFQNINALEKSKGCCYNRRQTCFTLNCRDYLNSIFWEGREVQGCSQFLTNK